MPLVLHETTRRTRSAATLSSLATTPARPSSADLRWLDTPPEGTGGTQGSFHVDDEIAFTTTTGTPIGEPITPPYRTTVRHQVTRELIDNLAPAGIPCPITEHDAE